MDRQRVETFKSEYDLIVHEDEDSHVEFWYARYLIAQNGDPSEAGQFSEKF